MTGLFGKNHKENKELKDKKRKIKKLVKEKKYDQVLKTGLEILNQNPDDIDVNFIIGGLFFMQGKFSKSLPYIDKVLEFSSFDPEALLLKANVLYNLRKYAESKKLCKKIQEIDPKNKDVEGLLKHITHEK